MTRGRYTAEWQLSDPVQTWLRRRGFSVYVEVPNFFGTVDMVGATEDTVVTVELKLCLNQDVVYQAYRNMPWCHAAWVAIASNPKPKGVEKCRRQGIGILLVCHDKVSVLLEAKSLKPDRTLSLRKLNEGGTAGHKTRKGHGPAIKCFNQVKDYLAQHPKATWQEIYDNVPNHYVSAKSMGGALSYQRWRWEVECRQLGLDVHGNLVDGR